MKDVITNRKDLYLAKVAGRNVDISTMTPPVPADMTEALLLEIADRIGQGGSGGGDEYLITAEMSMPEAGTLVLSNFQHDGESAVAADAIAAFNGGKQVRIFATGIGDAIDTNISLYMDQYAGTYMWLSGIGILPENGIPVWKIVSCYIVGFGNNVTLNIIDTLPNVTNSDHNKVLGTDNSGNIGWVAPPNNDLKVTFTVTMDNDNITVTANKAIKTEILPAIAANKNVYADANLGEYTLRYFLSAHNDAGINGGMVAFGCVIPDMEGGTSLLFSVYGAAALDDGSYVDTWTPFIPS